ncbi:hypothetical protein SynWH8103_00486 [Synechococcus sp. WH 8103]|nr:hypothetical protein SynWH8103_00486 [Synechococcus sp. WH 8103]
MKRLQCQVAGMHLELELVVFCHSCPTSAACPSTTPDTFTTI